ncbi:MAG: CpXC domain-containing protein [Candidatus Binatia bacterium]
MSKKLEASVKCPNCGHEQNSVLFRTIWAEEPENRSLILSDRINQFRCGNCNHTERLKFPFLCTNVAKGVAIWYEPYPDAQIDADVVQYRKHMGPNSFYAQAPRIADWETFKAKFLELEAAGPQPGQKPKYSSESRKMFSGFIDSLKRKKPLGR